MRDASGEANVTIGIVAGESSGDALAAALIAAMRRVTKRMMPDSTVVPAITTGGTDAKFFRWKGIPAYGFEPYRLTEEDAGRAHGHDERLPVGEIRYGVELLVELLGELDR